MRKRHALIVAPIALVALTSLSVTGQEEPLPKVTPRAITAPADAAPAIRYVALAVEPIRAVAPPTLAEAARRHDYVTFNALYTRAKSEGADVAAFDALHELWSWSLSDPLGAFYGVEMHARLSRAYPGFAAYIDEHRIVDARGSVFYPTSETRAFLLARALEGGAPRVLLADSGTEAPAAEAQSAADVREAASTRLLTATVSPRQAAAPASRVIAPKGSAPSRDAAPSVAKRDERILTSVSGETTAKATPASAPAPSAAPVATAAPAIAALPSPDRAPASSTDQVPLARESVFADRGILLLIIGLVGVSLMALMLRTPGASTPHSILQPGVAAEEHPAAAADAINVAPVETIDARTKRAS